MTFPGEKSAHRPLPGPSAHRLLFIRSAHEKGEPDALGSLRFLDGKPGTLLRAQPSVLKQKTNRSHEGTMKEIDQKTSRHHGSGTRPNRIEVILTDEENSRLEALSAAAGVKPTQLIRKLIMGSGTVKAALTAEERKLITDLSKMGTNIWQIRKDLINYGLDENALSDIDAMYDEFAKIKEHFKAKLQK